MNGRPEISIVIPVFNGGRSIGPLVRQLAETFAGSAWEVVLVNDGSADESEVVCSRLVDEFDGRVTLLHLARNFGEHNAVLAGVKESAGEYVAIIDDDAQQAPQDIARMLDELREKNHDVVYGRYEQKQHSWFRNLGSRFNDRMANVMLRKPPELYLSSFKVMNRFLADEICKYQGPFPYIDGLILRSTQNFGQLTVGHRQRAEGRSNYTLRRLVRLWLNMFLNFSILPLRLAATTGILFSLVSLVILVAIVIDKVWVNPELTVGIPSVLVAIVFFAGIQLFLTGMVGEYLGRVFLDSTGTPQYVVRYVKRGQPRGEQASLQPEKVGSAHAPVAERT
jgi:undecaprenyl-phosphate 4-deoxy-4-formamido-L-arabinose transferase